MSDRQTWLEEWCPQCHAAPGRRCGERRFRADRSTGQFLPSPRLHVARGWIERRCPTCKSFPGEACRAPSGKPAAVIHAARLRPGSSEISGPAVWAELERCGMRVVEVAFSGRNGSGGRAGPISVSRGAEASLVEIGRWASATSSRTRSRRPFGIATARSRGSRRSAASSGGRLMTRRSSSSGREVTRVSGRPYGERARRAPSRAAIAAGARSTTRVPAKRGRPGGNPVFQTIGVVSAAQRACCAFYLAGGRTPRRRRAGLRSPLAAECHRERHARGAGDGLQPPARRPSAFSGHACA